MGLIDIIEVFRSHTASSLKKIGPDQWEDVEYFKPSEFFDHLPMTSSYLILALNEFRRCLRFPVYISPINWGSHSARSYHYIVENRNTLIWAVDVFPKCDLAYAREIALKIPFFGGIGTYPYWKWPDKEIQGGLHLDIRIPVNNRITWWQDFYKTNHFIHKPDQTFKLYKSLCETSEET